MIDKNFKALLSFLGFQTKNDIFRKNFAASGVYLEADFNKQILVYPESAGLQIHERQTCNFASSENAVVFECVCKLLEKGYKPQHIELEPKWKLGHGASGGRADILVRNQENKPLLIIECKTYEEFNKAWKDTREDGGQLFSYAQQISETQFLCLYASAFDVKANELTVAQRIISHKDNDKILAQDEGLKSFAKASNVKQRFDVWQDTYQLEYTESGIFESNIQPYHIGKNNYTLDIDTRPVTDQDKKGKYHHFATILRQHNIARKETAFEVLVNLFLAKIVDEEENKENLDFYWKGIAYDNYYDFIDRLQKLYQIGMRKFLKDEVMYISNSQIDDAFWTVKNKRNATKKQVKKYFRDLKFFSNNAFSLINVHNERLFNRNTKVLVEIVQMWQGLRLKTKEQNQFLGDMFEYFLDNSIKQSEGQFFTPMPITKFIVSALPLEDKIKQSTEPLNAIDFACGAGHFLTEYAHHIKPLVAKHKQTDISQYYEHIVGIEKEDRLAKVAKVSAYMYGQDQIKILEEDALSPTDNIKNESFDVLVANPPFAVKGFLLNLTDKEKEQYELIQTTEGNSDTNNIQCFFMERAKQLMAANGVVGIIVPSSLLSKADATHIGTREIILKYFDMIAIVEFSNGTFGKTGTPTVVLFLRRKNQKPEPAEHYANRVEDYFEGGQDGDASQAEYQDLGLVKKYCQHIDVPFNEYKKLFGITVARFAELDTLLTTDIFSDYTKDFDSRTDIRNLKGSKGFKGKSQTEQTDELHKRFIAYLYRIEKDKMYYFMLAHESPQQILFIKSPSDNKAIKKLLGYDWSGAKGNEGIKYNGGSTVNDIITPLFNPNDSNDKTKISHLIQQNFLGKVPSDLSAFSEHQDLITYTNVQNILDFSRKDFNKSFSLSQKKNVMIDSKWNLVKIKDVLILEYGKPLPETERIEGEYPVYGSNGVVGTHNDYLVKAPCLIVGRKGSAGEINWAEKNCTPIDTTFYVSILDKNKILLRYIYEILKMLNLPTFKSGSGSGGINRDDVYSIKIPLPPKKAIQEKIVAECEAIDQASEQAQATIDKAKLEIEKGFNEASSKATKILRLNNADIFEVSIGKRVVAKEIERAQNGIPVYSANVFEPFGYINKQLLKDFDRPSVLWGIDGDWMVNHINRNKPFYPTDHCGVLRIKGDKIHYRYLTWALNKAGEEVRFSRNHRASIDRIKGLSIQAPSMDIQKALVAKIEKLEAKISKSQIVLDGAAQQKQAIMDKYLK